MWTTHWTGLCILKLENVSSSCRDIIVSVLWEMNLYVQLLCVQVLTFCGKKTAAPPPSYGPVKAILNLMSKLCLCVLGKFVPVAYGVQKLQISCVVEDDKVGTEFLEEKITEFEDFVSFI